MHKSRASLGGKTSQHVFTSDVVSRHQKVQAKQAARERTQNLQKEAADKEAAAVKADNGRDRGDAEQSKGYPLSGHQLIQRLKKLNNRLIFEPSRNTSGKTTGIYVEDQSLGAEGKRYLGIAFQTENNPEFDVIEKQDMNRFGQVNKRGWRTVVARLVRERLISLPKADVVFGQPSKESEFWANAIGGRV